MSREDRASIVYALYEITKSTLQRNSVDPTIALQDEIVEVLFRKGLARFDRPIDRGACKEAISDFCDKVKADLRDWGSDRSRTAKANTGSVADEFALEAQGSGIKNPWESDSINFDEGQPNRYLDAATGLAATITDRSLGATEVNYTAPALDQQNGEPTMWAPGSEFSDLAAKPKSKPGDYPNLDNLVVPADAASTFSKAKKVLATAASPWPSDLGAPAKHSKKAAK